MRSLRNLLYAISACLAVLGVGATSAQAAVVWESHTWVRPTHLVPGESAYLNVELANVGDEPSAPSPETVLRIELPDGMRRPSGAPFQSGPWQCFGTSTAICSMSGQSFKEYTATHDMSAFSPFVVEFEVEVDAEMTGTATATTTVTGGGASETSVEVTELVFAKTPLGFGFAPGSVSAGIFDEAGQDFTQAGGHGFEGSTDFVLNLTGGSYQPGPVVAGNRPKDIVVDLPPGLVGDPTAVPQCPHSAWRESAPSCPDNTQIGVVYAFTPVLRASQLSAIYNMEPPANRPAQFAFRSPAGKVVINPIVRADGGISMVVRRLTEAGDLWRSRVVIWGVPADPAHDDLRCMFPNAVAWRCVGYADNGGGFEFPQMYEPHSHPGPRRPLLSNPTRCGGAAPQTDFLIDSWFRPVTDIHDRADPHWAKATVVHPSPTGCDQLPFSPDIDLAPTTQTAESPSGLTARLETPQGGLQDPDGIAAAHLKRAVVELPEGVSINPAAANGMMACNRKQIGLLTPSGKLPARFTDNEPACPAGSKVADVKVTTPLLDEELGGEVFVAAQNDNPYGSIYGLYAIIRGPGILIKLPGKVDADPVSGQLRTEFDHNPQLPFSDLTLDFHSGSRSVLATPQTCGTRMSSAEFAPWSADDPDHPETAETVKVTSPFTVNASPTGACVDNESKLPFDLAFTAGSREPVAGAFSPFTVRLVRSDGHQYFDKITISPPAGLMATLRNTPYCDERAITAATGRSGHAEAAEPSCPAESRIGSTVVGAGAGSHPFYVTGDVYLAGPYRGAPLSMVFIVPAVAGPFDLGVQVVRAQLRVDPFTAQITAESDEIPKILEGVPLRIRDIRVAIDRPEFTLNPTNCAEQQVAGRVFGSHGAVSAVSNRFQVDGCAALGFAPKFRARILNKGRRSTLRSFNPRTRFTVVPRPGDANIGGARVALPSSTILDQSNLDTTCTRERMAAENCPAGSVVGYARAWSPLLRQPVQGPVYLAANGGARPLPDLMAVMDGQVRVSLLGEVSTLKTRGKARLQNTFRVVPDAPVTRFVLTMRGGKQHGLLVNSTDLCRSRERGVAVFHGQNGRRHRTALRLTPSFKGCGKVRRQARKKAARKKARQSRVLRGSDR